MKCIKMSIVIKVNSCEECKNSQKIGRNSDYLREFSNRTKMGFYPLSV